MPVIQWHVTCARSLPAKSVANYSYWLAQHLKLRHAWPLVQWLSMVTGRPHHT